MTETVLFVDDEENILNAIDRTFRERAWTLRKARNAESALAILRQENVAVVVSDNLMPGTSGIEMLCQVREQFPDTVRVLMTAFGDLATAVAAINRSEIFRFVLKPWNNSELEWVVDESLARYRAVRCLIDGGEAKLLSLARTVELKDPYTRGHCERVGEYAVTLARELGLTGGALEEIRYGGWLHDCGKIGVPEAILNLNGPLDAKQFEIIKKHPLWGADVARQARLPERVVNIILHHHERFDGQGYPGKLAGCGIPLEARVVSIADVFDTLLTDRPYRKGVPKGKAMQILGGLKGSWLDPELVDLFLKMVDDSGDETGCG